VLGRPIWSSCSQEILLFQPPEQLGPQACANMPDSVNRFLVFFFLFVVLGFELGFVFARQASSCFCFIFEWSLACVFTPGWGD
jgi:hypothetical protein